MKVAVLRGKRDIRVEKMAIPEPKENEVVVKVKTCGICGSDLPRYFEGRVHFFPIVLGHEFAGVVEKCGAGVDNVKISDHVVGIPLICCHKCPDCKVGDYSLCKNYKFIGSAVNGAMAEYIVVPQRNVLKINSEIDFSDAAFFEVSAVALHAVKKLGDITGKTVYVLGAGTVGILCGQWAKITGASKVIMLGRDKVREKIAQKAGLNFYLNMDDENDIQKIKKNNSNSYFIDAVGKENTIQKVLDISGSRSKICFVGTPDKKIELNSKQWEQINRKELTLIGAWMGYSDPFPGDEWSKTSEEVSNGNLILGKALIYKSYPLDNVKEAFELFASGEKVKGRVLLSCS